jgi:hypothetical protein
LTGTKTIDDAVIEECQDTQLRILEQDLRVACFALPYREDIDPEFSAGLNPLMWSHYADRNEDSEYGGQGSAIIINLEKLLECFREANIKILIAKRVSYHIPGTEELRTKMSIRPVQGRNEILESMLSGINERWFRKSIEWEHEAEYRILVDNNGQEDLYININPAITGLMLHNKHTADGVSSYTHDTHEFLKRKPDLVMRCFYNPMYSDFEVNKGKDKLTQPYFMSSKYSIPEIPTIMEKKELIPTSCTE